MLSGVLAIATEDTVALYRDVAVGEVWIAAGQSNMSWPVARAAERAEARPTGRIRLFRADPTFADERGRLDSTELARLNRLDYIRNPQGWVSGSDTAAVEEFSAVAWFFGQMLADSLGAGVPVGLIEISLGGAPAEAFVSRRILEDDPALVDVLYDWRNNEMAQDWVRGVIRGNLEGVKNPLQRHFFEPAYLYESRVAPLAAGYDAEGVIWYQGESNAHNAELHERLFPAVVKSFREAFNQNFYGRLMPFYFVQLSSLNRPSWPHFRESQRRLEERLHGWDNVHMVVSSDLGDSTDVHPRHKKPIGERLARRCLFQRYSYPNRFKSLETAQSPTVIDGATQYYDTVFVDFSRPLATLDDEPVRGFEIEAADGKFYPATGRIEGRQVILTASSEGPLRLQGTPPRIRYGWQPFTRANLCGVAPYRMPVSTFEIRVNCSKH